MWIRKASDMGFADSCRFASNIDKGTKMNYESGRFLAVDATESEIGRIDCDEFIRDHSGQPIYRVDGDEVYDLNGVPLGTLNSGRLEVNGKLIFKLLAE